MHGDLLGNVLFAAGLPPAVIDISPYWRPPEYAEAIVVADALCWYGATPTLLTEAGVAPAAVARALLFRMGTASECNAPGLHREAGRYRDVAASLGWRP